MSKTKRDRKPSGMVKILNVLTVLLAIIMLIFLGRMVNELHRCFARDPYTSIDYNLQQGNYADMVTEYYRRGFDVAPFSGAHEEEYYVAQYMDAAFMHQFFRAVGDSEAADRYASLMESARLASGSLAAVTGDMDRLLDGIPLHP